MARKRMISPEIWESHDFSRLSLLAKMIFIGLFSLADDEGRGIAKAMYIKSKLFPYDEKLRVADVESSLDEIADNMSTTFYSYNGNEYYALDHWTKWQRLDRPSKSKLPAYDEKSCKLTRRKVSEPSANVREMLGEDSTNARRTPGETSANTPGTPTVDKISADKGEKVIELPLNDKSMYDIFRENIEHWEELYPAVDIMQELRKMKGWLENNKKKQKTRQGIARFIGNWLSKAQDRGGSSGFSAAARDTNKYEMFTNDYDYSEVENRVWQKDKKEQSQ